MPRQSPAVPPFRVHKATGQAYVTLEGRRVYLGRHDAADALERYTRTIEEWKANGRQSLDKPPDITVVELTERYWLSVVQPRYPKRTATGKPVGEAWHYLAAVTPLNALYGTTPATDFGPLKLKAVRARYVERGLSRRYTNRHVERIKRLFRWAVAEELVPSAVRDALLALEGLRCGETTAPEPEPVRPVPDSTVEATIAACTPTLAVMIRLQMLTGMRPGELCILRTGDLDTSGTVWTYTPERHKTAHRGRTRVVYLGPRAQAILTPFLRTDLQAAVFSPAASEAERNERRHAERVTPAGQGNEPGTNRKQHPRKQPGDCYTTDTYRQAIEYACDRAWPIPDDLSGEERTQWRRDHRWHPNQIRHSFATHVRREHGLEAAQVLLGHAYADVTQVYAESDAARAVAVAAKIG